MVYNNLNEKKKMMNCLLTLPGSNLMVIHATAGDEENSIISHIKLKFLI